LTASKNDEKHFFQFSREENGETVTVSRILFHPKINDHEKEITCRAENTEILNSAIDDNKILNIHCKFFDRIFISFISPSFAITNAHYQSVNNSIAMYKFLTRLYLTPPDSPHAGIT
jgi:hypothetical protein